MNFGKPNLIYFDELFFCYEQTLQHCKSQIMIVFCPLMPLFSSHLMNVTQLFAVSSSVTLSTELAGFVFFLLLW